MPGLLVRDLDPADLPAAAALLAARFAADRARLPVLDSSFESPSACAAALAELAGRTLTDALVAIDDGELVGFLVGRQRVVSPGDYAAQFTPPGTVEIDELGHAARAGSAVDVYRALYAGLAGRWVARGCFEHRVDVVPGDRDVEEAWVSLGFGRAMTAATRTLADVLPTAPRSDVTVTRATPEDIDVTMALAEALARHHARSPMFWPLLPLTFPAQRDLAIAALARDDCPTFIAHSAGRPVGMHAFLGELRFSPRIVPAAGDIYLWEGIVEEDARGLGVGTQLLAESLNWAAGHGYRTCTLHFASGNPSGAPFWLGHGFVPVLHTMSRHVDERIAWAHP